MDKDHPFLQMYERFFQGKADPRDPEETRRIIKEAAALRDRPIPDATHEWRDIHRRHHIAPWPEQERKHEIHSAHCWCVPTFYQGVIVHWDDHK